MRAGWKELDIHIQWILRNLDSLEDIVSKQQATIEAREITQSTHDKDIAVIQETLKNVVSDVGNLKDGFLKLGQHVQKLENVCKTPESKHMVISVIEKLNLTFTKILVSVLLLLMAISAVITGKIELKDVLPKLLSLLTVM